MWRLIVLTVASSWGRLSGRQALEEMRKGVLTGINVARLLVTSPEFRDELIKSVGVIQEALRRRGADRMGTKLTPEVGCPEGRRCTGDEQFRHVVYRLFN